MGWNTVLRNAGFWVLLSLAAGHLTEQQTSTIVEVHNELRTQVQPSAAFMQKVVWDETLRLVAEAYAAKCLWYHNPELKSLKMGENLYVSTGPFNETKALLDWFKEKDDYDFENNTCSEDAICGHYTQLVWADSKKIGCAAHVCETIEGLQFSKATLLICNYYPRGNFEAERPYESGESCSKCPEELPLCEENVCVKLFPSEEPPEPTQTTPAVSTEHPAVPSRISEPSTVPEEPTQGHKTVKKMGIESDSRVERPLAPLLMLLWTLAAFIL